jgi:hypothetical protein
MAYFAQIDEDGVVLQVIAVSNTDAPDPAPEHSEPKGQAFIRDVLGLPGEWRQTSFNQSWRKNYAGPGFRYDSDADVFVAPQPFPSWSLDENHDWQPPVPYPLGADPMAFQWDEGTFAWVSVSA